MFCESGLCGFAAGEVDVLSEGWSESISLPVGAADQSFEPETSDVWLPAGDGVAASRRVAGEPQAGPAGASARRVTSNKKGSENKAQSG